jgi:hypothetical protein
MSKIANIPGISSNDVQRIFQNSLKILEISRNRIESQIEPSLDRCFSSNDKHFFPLWQKRLISTRQYCFPKSLSLLQSNKPSASLWLYSEVHRTERPDSSRYAATGSRCLHKMSHTRRRPAPTQPQLPLPSPSAKTQRGTDRSAIPRSDEGHQNVEEDTKKLANYAELLETHFPRAVPDAVLIAHTARVLREHGFTPETSINLVSTCRDEICRPFVEQLDQVSPHPCDLHFLAVAAQRRACFRSTDYGTCNSVTQAVNILAMYH